MAIPDFYIGTGALNLGPRACIANTLPHWAVSPAPLPKVSQQSNEITEMELPHKLGGGSFFLCWILRCTSQHYFTLLVLSFRRGSRYAVQSGIKLSSSYHQPLECWDHKRATTMLGLKPLMKTRGTTVVHVTLKDCVVRPAVSLKQESGDAKLLKQPPSGSPVSSYYWDPGLCSHWCW